MYIFCVVSLVAWCFWSLVCLTTRFNLVAFSSISGSRMDPYWIFPPFVQLFLDIPWSLKVDLASVVDLTLLLRIAHV